MAKTKKGKAGEANATKTPRVFTRGDGYSVPLGECYQVQGKGGRWTLFVKDGGHVTDAGAKFAGVEVREK